MAQRLNAVCASNDSNDLHIYNEVLRFTMFVVLRRTSNRVLCMCMEEKERSGSGCCTSIVNIVFGGC